MLRPHKPSSYVSHVVDTDVCQSNVSEHFRNVRAARRFRTGRRWNRRQLGLARQRDLIGAFDVRAGRADAVVGENCVDHNGKV